MTRSRRGLAPTDGIVAAHECYRLCHSGLVPCRMVAGDGGLVCDCTHVCPEDPPAYKSR